MMARLSDIDGTKWDGSAELWLDPLGDEVVRSDCTISVEDDVIRYRWNHEGKDHEGSLVVRPNDAQFTDSWHQPEPMRCRHVEGAWGLTQVQGVYGPDSNWGWRIALTLRAPTDELVLQMTNIAPWGEEARAVRMTCTRR